MKLMKIDRFRKVYFEEESAPDPRTVRNWIDTKAVPGVVLNGHPYIDQEKWEALLLSSGDDDITALVQKVLGNDAAAA